MHKITQAFILHEKSRHSTSNNPQWPPILNLDSPNISMQY
jgi:hypothetical protein